MDQGIYCDLVIAIIPWLEAALRGLSQGARGGTERRVHHPGVVCVFIEQALAFPS